MATWSDVYVPGCYGRQQVLDSPKRREFDSAPCVCEHERRNHAAYIYTCAGHGCACIQFVEKRHG